MHISTRFIYKLKNPRGMKIRAVALLSGGLDSTLAAKLILDQGIDVVALNFTSPFCTCNHKGRCRAVEAANQLKMPIKMISKGDRYLKIVRKPKHGYGSAMNPCIDCRIFILKEAKKYAKQIGAKFIFTGEVLGERPMSQHRRALEIIEKESGLKGKLLRPLSAKLLEDTEAEKKGWVDRTKLMDIKGRHRGPQMSLAKTLHINDYPCPGGGCLLTYPEFANKVKDLFGHKKSTTLRDIELLKYGRHFRIGNSKIIVGRNEKDNHNLERLKYPADYMFEAKDFKSPITILQGKKTKEIIKMAAELTARYSDANTLDVTVTYGNAKRDKMIVVKKTAGHEHGRYLL